jgi:hypothetical protein
MVQKLQIFENILFELGIVDYGRLIIFISNTTSGYEIAGNFRSQIRVFVAATIFRSERSERVVGGENFRQFRTHEFVFGMTIHRAKIKT